MAHKRKSGSVSEAIAPPDQKKVEKAIRALLGALGLDPDDPALEKTPAKTAEAYVDALTSGYRTSAKAALGKGFPVSINSPIVAAHIPAMFVCPHHLLPARGEVHVAFQPNGRVPGLARIARLVDTLGRRLVLQEDLGVWIANALVDHLGVTAAVVIIDAKHLCVAAEDFARRDTSFTTRARVGPPDAVASLDKEIDATLRRAWPTSASEPLTEEDTSSSQLP